MTRAAWIMMLVTWAVITYFAGRFFWQVLKTPPRDEGDALERSAQPGGIAGGDRAKVLTDANVVVCGVCLGQNPLGARHCRQCGRELEP